MTALEELEIREFIDQNNDTFLPLFYDAHRYLVLKGGGGSGKSIFAGRKILERVTGELEHRILVCRKVAKTLKESCYAQLKRQIAEYYQYGDFRFNESNMTIDCIPTGSRILFAGLDDVEKLKSIYRVTSIWIEEASELLESDFNQLDIRLRGETASYKQIILSFNPISTTHWLKKRFFDTKDERARINESTYRDNKFLDEEQIRTLESFRERDPYYYQVYCLGQWGVYGKTVFDAAKVAKRLLEVGEPLFYGYFAGRKMIQDAPDGYIAVYKEPEEGVPYVLGGDTAGEGSDWYAAHVIDNRNGEQVAVLHRQDMDEDYYTDQIEALGKWYNGALIAVEANLTTYPIRELSRRGYPRQFVRQTEDNYTGKLKQSFGVRTDKATRPVMIAELVAFVREHVDKINDRATLEEMLTFVRNEKGRPEAEEGAHDDLVMSLCITHYAREQQRTAADNTATHVEWTDDYWEDYYNADDEGRIRLIEKRGNPF